MRFAARLAFHIALLTGGLAVSVGAQEREPTAVPVVTVSAERKSIAQSLDFVGRVEATNRLEVRARVEGYLEAVLFKEGDLIKEGDPLYRIEQGLFKAAVEQAQGAVERKGIEDSHCAAASARRGSAGEAGGHGGGT
jgi:membrane fusion protein (multidrug efflux system)